MKGDIDKAVENFNRVHQGRCPIWKRRILLTPTCTRQGASRQGPRASSTSRKAHIGKTEHVMLKKAQVHRAQQDMGAVERDLKDLLKIKEGSLEAMGALRDLYIGRKAWPEALEIEEKIRKQIKTPDEDLRLAGLKYETPRSFS